MKRRLPSAWFLLKPGVNQKSILLVDDDPVFVKAMTRRLRSEGFEVVAALDGAEAVSAVRRGKPDLILLDIVFPPDVANGGGVSWDGFLILSWLRRMGGLTDVPVIMMTASEPGPYAERVHKTGASALFQKTVPAEIMLHHIHRVIGEQVAQAENPQESLG